MIRSIFAFTIVSSIIFSGCSGTKQLGAGEYLYTGSEINLNANYKIPDKGELKSELETLVRPEPNASLFGLRPSVWIYNITADSTPNKGFGSWLNRTLGQPPVLLRQVNPDNTQTLIKSKLYNSGYFQAEVDYEVVQEKKKAHLIYNAYISEPYTIDSIIYPQAKDTLRRALASMREESLLTKGSRYDVQVLTEERERLSREVKDYGFYYFAPEYLIYTVDSTVGEKKLHLWLNVKEGVPNEALKQYRLERITVNPNYTFVLDSVQQNRDTINVNDYNYILSNRDIKPHVITDAIFLNPDSIYSRTAHEQTLNRLMGLGIFQFANVQFDKMKGSTGNDLRATVQLTPVKKKSISFELQGVSTSFYVGPDLNVTFQNRNFLGGAELFQLRFNGGMEFNTGSSSPRALNAYNFGVESNIYFPRFVVPFFNIKNESSYYVPKTRLRAAFNRTNRVDLFKLNSSNLALGYIWNETRSKRHELFPIDISFLQLSDTSGAFHRRLQQDEFLQSSYEEQFILSSTYTYTFNNQHLEDRRHNFYFQGSVDVSGNVMHLIQSALNEREATSENPYTIFNTAYSQYAKGQTDIRYYYSIDQNNTIATRLLVGVGVPYGNSNNLPFVKQFFIGGTNSIRAFEARSIGPGTTITDIIQQGNVFYDQLGEMKIEGNIEYRFPIYSVFKGALFLEAGNIWLVNSQNRAQVFSFDNFLNELAVGTGFGLRLDVDFFVLRFDFGVPLRVPQGWVWNELPAAVDKNWNDITFNIGIGYPF